METNIIEKNTHRQLEEWSGNSNLSTNC